MSANDRQVSGNHYRKTGSKKQHWDMVHEFGLDYFQGNITKYLFRWREKNGIDDLRKAQHYLEKYIEIACEELARKTTIMPGSRPLPGQGVLIERPDGAPVEVAHITRGGDGPPIDSSTSIPGYPPFGQSPPPLNTGVLSSGGVGGIGTPGYATSDYIVSEQRPPRNSAQPYPTQPTGEYGEQTFDETPIDDSNNDTSKSG